MHPDERGPTIVAWRRAVQRLDRWDYVIRVKTRDGGYRHVRGRAVPIVERGEVVEWIGTFADVEQEWQEERRKELLDRAAAATADLGSLDEVLRTLADVIVPALADVCGIFLLPEFGGESIRPPFVVERLISVVRTGIPPALGPQTIDEERDFVTVIRTRRPILRVFPEGEAPPGSVPPGAETYFARTEGNSVAQVPVIVDGAVAAVVAAGRYGDRERLDPNDVDLLGRMLAHAHVHLSNAMRFQRTQRMALALQNYLLPDPPRVPGLEIATRYRARATSAEIGGDWYDCFVRPDGSTVLTIGDVAGHDLPAAVTMSQLRNILRGLAMDRQEPPGDILRRMDVATEALDGEGTASCILAHLEGSDSGGWSLRYSVAGHPPPLLVTHGGEARFLDGAVNPLLGAGYDMPRSSSVAVLPARSTLLLYTDGLVEVPGEHLDMGLERLRQGSAELVREPLDDFCDKLLQLPVAYKDDIAMIAVRLPGELSHPGGLPRLPDENHTGTDQVTPREQVRSIRPPAAPDLGRRRLRGQTREGEPDAKKRQLRHPVHGATAGAAAAVRRRCLTRAAHAALRLRVEEARLHPDDVDLPDLLNHVADDLDRLENLINDLLLLATLETGLGGRLEEVNLTNLVETVAPWTESYDVRLDLEAAVTVEAASREITRLLANLLDNARRHATHRLEVNLRRASDHAELAVADDGQGVPAADREHIFQRFTRLDTARSRDRGGAGLGLAIARDIASAHHGTLHVEDATDGGACFVFRIPLVR